MYVRVPEFLVRFSKAGNGKSHWKITGYPRGKRETHWFKDERSAKNEAERLNFSIRKYGPEAALPLNQRLDAYRGLQILDGTATLTEAAAFYVETKKTKFPPKPFKEVITECIELNRARAKTGEISRAQFDNLGKGSKRLLAEFGNRDIGAIAREDIVRWLDRIPVTATTRDFFRRYASVYFSFAITYGYLKDNPCTGIKNSSQEGEIRILDISQCRALMFAAPVHMIPYYALGIFAGLRPESEIKRLLWDAIDFTDRLVRVGNWKTGRHKRSARFRDVKMSDNLTAWLAPYREWTGPVWPMSWQTSHNATRRAAGITDWPRDAMRHSYGSYLLALTQNAPLVADQMGHQSAKMVYAHYRRLVRPAEAADFWNIYPQDALPEKILEQGQ